MFVDRVEIIVASGKGGAGCVSFRREKFVVQGGPNGGDGGRGGDLVFEVSNNTDTLSKFRGHHHFRAKNGEQGGSRNMTGKSAEPLVLKVPAGTQVFDAETDELLLDLINEGEKVVFLEGGKGGLGNTHFKSSTNQRPTYAQPGIAGVERKVRLELKLIADVGLVGFPNVGKSTLISAVSNARPEVANYEFTTLTPSLGVVNVGDYESFVMADIPGIISGASEGRGLGIEFLRHIERTNTLLFVLDSVGYRDLSTQYSELKKELLNYSKELSTRNYGIVFTRVDADPQTAKDNIEQFLEAEGLKATEFAEFGGVNLPVVYQEGLPKFAIPISSVAHFNLKPLIYKLHELIKGSKDANSN